MTHATEELRRICDAATKGPWTEHMMDKERVMASTSDGNTTVAEFGLRSSGLTRNEMVANATFCAAARTALPECLDRIRELEGMTAYLEKSRHEGLISREKRIEALEQAMREIRQKSTQISNETGYSHSQPGMIDNMQKYAQEITVIINALLPASPADTQTQRRIAMMTDEEFETADRLSEQMTIHTLDEFSKLSWDTLKPDQCTKQWSYGFGGYGFRNDQMWIAIIDSDLDADIWPLPAALAAIVATDSEIAISTLKRSLRTLIGASAS